MIGTLWPWKGLTDQPLTTKPFESLPGKWFEISGHANFMVEPM